MSQFNNNNNNRVQGSGNQIADELRALKLDKQQLDKRDKQIRFRCDHKDSHGRPATQQGKEDGTLVCRICGTTINGKMQNKVEVDRKLREVINIIEIIKLVANPELTPNLARIEEGVDSLLALYEKVILKAGENRNNNNNNNNNNTRRASYNQSKM